MKKFASAVLAMTMLAGSAMAEPASDCYPVTAMVTGLSYSTNEVFVETSSGNIFSFRGIEDYLLGDLVSMYMYTNGTPNVQDDEILHVEYAGSLDSFCRKAEEYFD